MAAQELIEAGLDSDDAHRIEKILQSEASPPNRWMHLAKSILRPEHPFELHQLLHRLCFADWNEQEKGPPPCWVPTARDIETSNLGPHLHGRHFSAFHAATVQDPEWFGSLLLDVLGIQPEVPPVKVLDTQEGPEHPRWFPGMQLNIGLSCFAGRSLDRTALIWAGEDSELQSMTLAELQRQAESVAWGLTEAGFQPGDAIAIDMPMTCESVVIYLGCVLAGCVVVSIADSFAPAEIQTRLEISKARGIFTQDVILRGGREIPLYQRVVEAEAPTAIVLFARETSSATLREGDLAWHDFLPAKPRPPFPVPVFDAQALTNILFSSGTTGTPKAIGWTHLTPIKAAADGWGHHDIQEGDVVCWPTNLGWMMGPWLIYASLLNGATIALYEGIPSGSGFCRFVEQAGVTMLGVVPSLVRAWKSTNATRDVDWSAIRTFSSTGEASKSEEMHWLMAQAGYQPVVEYCGGTEIGGGYICGSRVQAQVPSAFSTPALGLNFLLINEEGQPVDNGEVALLPPMLGSSQTLLNRDHHTVYFQGMPPGPQGETLRRHGDQITAFPGGFYRAMGRVDDTMNLGGIKVSSAEIERASTVTGVRECAAVAVSPPGGGPSQLVIFVVRSSDRKETLDDLHAAIQNRIRTQLNPLFKVHSVLEIEKLPRTASNKVMRRLLRERVVHG